MDELYTKLLSVLEKSYQQEVNNLTKNIETFESYKFTVGKVHGIAIALKALREVSNSLSKDDDPAPPPSRPRNGRGSIHVV